MSERIVMRRKNVGCIRRIEPYPPSSCKYVGCHYSLYDAKENFIERDTDFNRLAEKLRNM